MRSNRIYFIIALLWIYMLSAACTPTVRVSQSQQSWNEYKSKDVKHVTKAKDYRDKKNK
jgi:hypothetical protein